jgi:IstB-like ATP binding protein
LLLELYLREVAQGRVEPARIEPQTPLDHGLLVNRGAVARIIDRLHHHSITINIKGESFRLREKFKAGLLKPEL